MIHTIQNKALLFSFFLFSNSLFGMQLVKQNKILKTVHQKSISKRLFQCPCIDSFKKEIGEEYYASFNTINKAAEIVGFSFDLVNNKNQLLRESKWPKMEGAALENELQLKRYCSRFAHCAHKHNKKWGRHEMVRIISGPGCIITFPLSIMTGSPLFFLPATVFGSMAAYSVMLSGSIKRDGEILADIARKNLHYLELKYDNFKRAQQKLFNEFHAKELQEITSKKNSDLINKQ